MVTQKRYRITGRSMVPALGTHRRIQALAVMGWSVAAQAKRMHRSREYLLKTLNKDLVFLSTAEAVEAVYADLSMVVPAGHTLRTRNWAKAQGWFPPLAWDDIDDPDERPTSGRDRCGPSWNDVDDARIARILGGEWRMKCTIAEKRLIVGGWTRSFKELEALTGWKPERYYTVDEDVAS